MEKKKLSSKNTDSSSPKTVDVEELQWKGEEPRTEEDESSSQAVTETRRIHWRSGVGIVLGSMIAEAITLLVYFDDSTLRIYITLKYIFPIVAGLLILWWLFRSGFSRGTRMVGVGSALAAGFLFLSVLRLDRFAGDMWPQFSFRWRPTTEQRVAEYWKKAAAERLGAANSNGANAATVGTGSRRLVVTQDDWPRFRGAPCNGIVRRVSIRTDWEQNPPELIWKHPVGAAWSSFAVVGDRLFTQEQREELEAVVCYEASTGRQLWIHTDPARYSTSMGGTGPRATPTIYQSRIYTLGATGILNCLDPYTGERIWSKNILEDARAENTDWGMAGSPLVFDDVVVVNPGGDEGRAIAMYDAMGGRLLGSGGKHRASYVAPRMVRLSGVPQLIIYDASGVAGYDNTFTELWRFGWTNSDRINVAQPIVRDGSLVLISSGYGTGSALLEINFENGLWSYRERWRRPGQFKLKFNDAIYNDGFLYGLDEGILSCIEYETGERKWKRGRYGHGQILLINDDQLLLVQAENGEIVLVEATPDAHREITRFRALDDITWNHPVLNRGRLFVRNFKEAACYDLRPVPSAGTP